MKPTKGQLKTKYMFICHNFTAKELSNPKTAESVLEALKNIKVAMATAKE